MILFIKYTIFNYKIIYKLLNFIYIYIFILFIFCLIPLYYSISNKIMLKLYII